MRSSVWVLTFMVTASVTLLCGCEQEMVLQFQADRQALVAGGEVPAGRFFADVTFCRKIGKKTGKRIGEDQVFFPRKKSAVHGIVDFRGMPTDQVQSIHLVWIKPDGKELFRRYAEVLVTRQEEGYLVHKAWKNAEDLGYLKEKTEIADTPSFTLSSRFNTSLSRQRDLGQYLLRVYLNRELLLEAPFELRES